MGYKEKKLTIIGMTNIKAGGSLSVALPQQKHAIGIASDFK